MACPIMAFLLFVSSIHSSSADEDTQILLTESNNVKQIILEPDGQINVPFRQINDETLSPNEEINLNKEYLNRIRRDLEEDNTNLKQNNIIENDPKLRDQLSRKKRPMQSKRMREYWKRIRESDNTQRITDQRNRMKKKKEYNLTYEEFIMKTKTDSRTPDTPGTENTIKQRKHMSQNKKDPPIESDPIESDGNIPTQSDIMVKYLKLRDQLSRKKNPMHSLRMREYWKRIRESGNTQRITNQRKYMKKWWKILKKYNFTYEEHVDKMKQGWRIPDENGIEQRKHKSLKVKGYWKGVKSNAMKYQSLKKRLREGWRKISKHGIEKRLEQKERLLNYWNRIRNETSTERLSELRELFRELWRKRKYRKRNKVEELHKEKIVKNG